MTSCAAAGAPIASMGMRNGMQTPSATPGIWRAPTFSTAARAMTCLFGDAGGNFRIEARPVGGAFEGGTVRGGADRLLGGRGDDRLAGDAGDDIVNAGGPTDFGIPHRIVAGNDGLQGGDGDDRLYGDAIGNITVSEDESFATGGDDHLSGGRGDDAMFGDAGGSITKAAVALPGAATAGNDALDGGEGRDLLVGDASDLGRGVIAGNDSLVGGAGHDRLFGDSRDATDTAGGDDILDGGGGDDHLRGGAGDDRFVLSRGDDVVHDFAAGGPDDALVIGGVFADAADALANATESNGNTIFAYAGGTTTLIGVLRTDLSAALDFLV